MTDAGAGDAVLRLTAALEADSSSVRLQAALSAGTRPSADDVDVLIARCAVEPDPSVRDMLTWALVRNDPGAVVERLLAELSSHVPQARSQALHTLSKIGDPATWSAITPELLQDEDDEVARTAWRAAAGLVPAGGETALAETLATQFDRGDRDVQLSLSRAFVALGEPAAVVVARARSAAAAGVRAHATATERLMQDPDGEFDAAIAEARRVVALRDAPVIRE